MCLECRKVPRKDATIFNCYKCAKSFHDVCREMRQVQKSTRSGSITLYICKVCENKEELSTTNYIQLSNISTRASTPARPVAVTKVLATAKQVAAAKASMNKKPITSVLKTRKGSSSHNTTKSNSSSNNSNDNNNNSSQDNSTRKDYTQNISHNTVSKSEKEHEDHLSDVSSVKLDKDDVKNRHKLTDDKTNDHSSGVLLHSTAASSQLPRSRISTFAPTLLRSAVNAQSSPISAGRSKTSRCLDLSLLRNGTIILSMVTYANSIRDTVGKAISSQQGSIESKLVEIADFLSVFPSLTQKISSLESKIVEKQTPVLDAKIVALEKTFTSATNLINEHTDAINTKIVIIENSLVSSVKSTKSFAPSRSSESHSSNSSETSSSPVSSVNSVNSALYISNFINKKNANLKLAAFVALRLVSGSISLDDIFTCRPPACK